MDTSEVILKDDETTRYLQLWAQRSGISVDQKSFELGRMSVALMLESQARILEEFGTVLSDMMSKEQVASALRDVLRSLGIDDDVLETYQVIATMKMLDRPTYVPDELPSGHAYASQPSDPPDTTPLPQGTHESHPVRRTATLADLVPLLAEPSLANEESEAELAEEYRPLE